MLEPLPHSESGGALSLEEARAKAYSPVVNETKARELFNRLMSYPVDWINYTELSRLLEIAPRIAEKIWEMMKREVRSEFESGHLASKNMFPANYQQGAWQTASYLGLRESFAAEWKPKGGIELSLIDMLAQAFWQYLYWNEQVILRSQTEPRTEAHEYREWKDRQRAAQQAQGWGKGYWDIPYVHEQEALEHAAQMAERFNRIYLRTLRNLRDLRRYSSPVTIANAQQVNIAADGGQQLNINRKDD